MHRRAALSCSLLVASACNPVTGTGSLLSVPDAAVPPIDAGRPDTGEPDRPRADAGGGRRGRLDGSPCERDDQCGGGLCIRAQGFAGGYCSSACDDRVDCDRIDGECVVGFEGLPPFCARGCIDGAWCREGYACTGEHGPIPVCLPPPIAGEGDDGSPCRRDADCSGGLCLTGSDWRDGYCSTPNCFLSAECHPAGTAECVEATRFADADLYFTLCLERCASPDECREGYECLPIEFGVQVCAPDIPEPQSLDPLESYPFEIRCGATRTGRRTFELEYAIAAPTTGYMITPFTPDGRYLFPIRIALPMGEIDFRGENDFQAVTPFFRPYINPTVVPAVSQHAGQRQAGGHRFEIESSAEDLCWFLIEETAPGSRIDLRFYWVGTDLTAATAEDDANVAAMLTALDGLFDQVDLGVGDVTHHDVSAMDAERYGFLETFADVGRVVALSERVGGDLAGELVANVFMLRGIGFGAIGVSSGIPGAAGLHGTSASGVVVSAELLGQIGPDPGGQPMDGNLLTASIVAHELGHFLGLFHTTEIGSEVPHHDPILDTPECAPEMDPFACPDIGNVMFPFADPRNQIFTEGQGFSMKSNPLTKE